MVVVSAGVENAEFGAGFEGGIYPPEP